MIDIQQYIESGAIERYVLGEITEQERAEVECLATTYQEIASELESAAVSLSIMAELGATPPDSKMKEQIWNEISESEADIISLDNSNKSTNGESKSGFGLSSIVAAVFVIIAAGSIFWAVDTNNELSNAEQEIAELNSMNQNIVQDFSELKDIFNQNNNIYSLPNSEVVKLSGIEDKSPESIAYAIWDKASDEVYLDVKSLPKNPEGKQYQLWTISDKGQPISVGVFDSDGRKEIIKLGSADTSVMFAVTLEQAGGVESPTMEEMYVAGKVKS